MSEGKALAMAPGPPLRRGRKMTPLDGGRS